MRQNNRTSPQQASARASWGPSWESRPALRARAPRTAPLPGPPKLCRGRLSRQPAFMSAAMNSCVDATRGSTPRIIIGAGFSRGFLQACGARSAWSYPGHRPRELPCVPTPWHMRAPRTAGLRGVSATPRFPQLAATRRQDAGVSDLQPSLFWGENSSSPAPVVHLSPPSSPTLRPAGDASGHRPACLFTPAAAAADLKG